MKVIWILKKRRVATLIKEFGLERKIKIHKTHSLQRKHDSDSPPPSTHLLLYCGSADAGVKIFNLMQHSREWMKSMKWQILVPFQDTYAF